MEQFDYGFGGTKEGTMNLKLGITFEAFFELGAFLNYSTLLKG